MKIGFVVNRVTTEQPGYTTTRLAMAASRAGHDVWLMGVDDFAHEPEGTVTASARTVPKKKYRALKPFLAHLQDEEAVKRLDVDELDVLAMRNDPSEDVVDRPWAVASGILFGQLAASRGVLVVNDPFSLANAVNKTYFQNYPEKVRPRTMISREVDEIRAFIKELKGAAVLKPLQGSGGAGVFLVSNKEAPNLNQMIEALARDGYIVVQEYLAAAKAGDVRLFVMNGAPLSRDGRIAAFRRVNQGEDLRSNMHVGGEAQAVEVTDEMLHLVEVVRPKLIEDGMFLAGLDIVGSKLMEVNVFSPGGLGSCQRLYDVDFASPVIAALEHKVELRRHYPTLGNAELATL
ncbi:MAG TPA: glutathione synthetase [Acidimicrobiia bacterium]|nr:glutathione synthetase [Acidimicrobiia bacterium]